MVEGGWHESAGGATCWRQNDHLMLEVRTDRQWMLRWVHRAGPMGWGATIGVYPTLEAAKAAYIMVLATRPEARRL